MTTYAKDSSHKSSPVLETNSQSVQFKDNREAHASQNRMKTVIDTSARVAAQNDIADTISKAAIQRKANTTGLPDQLKTGIEHLSGIDMSDTRVHYNSSKPAQLNAHAYAQGTDIHMAPGQEKHLAHEAWHVVQQKQGRVQPTTQLKSKTLINDDVSLEREADIMGAKAMQGADGSTHNLLKASKANGPIQRYSVSGDWKISDDVTFALKGKKHKFYATEPQIDKSNKMLKLSGSKGSLIHLTKGSNKNVEGVAMKKVVPSLDAGALARFSQYSHHQELTANNTDRFKLWRDCERASEAVTGTEDNENRRTKISSTGASHGLKLGGSRNALKDDTAHSLTAQIYMFNLAPFLATKAQSDPATYINLDLLEAGDYADNTFASTENNSARALRVYNALKPTAKEAFDKFAKINDYALPEVGDSYVISSETEMPGFEEIDDEAWQFHWGGVIMRAGHDVATLESESSGDPDDIDRKWKFGVNGTKKVNGTITGDSFNKIHLDTELHGTKTTTIAVTNAHTPKDARDFAKQDYPDQLKVRLEAMEGSDAQYQNLKNQWDTDYTTWLEAVDVFLSDASRLKDFQKNVMTEIRTELTTLKTRRDLLND